MFLLATKELAPEDLTPANGNAKAELAEASIPGWLRPTP